MICPLNLVNSDKYGTKAHNLGVLINNNIPTVNGYCIKPGYYDEDILGIWMNLKKYKFIAVRSSMAEEDMSNSSSAGKFNTILGVDSLDDIKYAVDYIFKKSKSKNKSIICQPMVNSHISGVMFTKSPGDKNKVMIEASYGLGELLVSGKICPDRYEIDRETRAINMTLGNKVYGMFLNTKSLKIGECSNYIFGNVRCSIDMGTKYLGTFLTSVKKKSSLDEYFIHKLVETGLKIEKIFGAPQDIEWAIDKDGLKILQSRNVSSFMEYKQSKAYDEGKLCGLGVSTGTVKGKIIKN
jgi:pyruvate,water dikinase